MPNAFTIFYYIHVRLRAASMIRLFDGTSHWPMLWTNCQIILQIICWIAQTSWHDHEQWAISNANWTSYKEEIHDKYHELQSIHQFDTYQFVIHTSRHRQQQRWHQSNDEIIQMVCCWFAKHMIVELTESGNIQKRQQSPERNGAPIELSHMREKRIEFWTFSVFTPSTN